MKYMYKHYSCIHDTWKTEWEGNHNYTMSQSTEHETFSPLTLETVWQEKQIVCPFHEAFSCISVQFHRHPQMKFAKLARFTTWGKTACELKGVVNFTNDLQNVLCFQHTHTQSAHFNIKHKNNNWKHFHVLFWIKYYQD